MLRKRDSKTGSEDKQKRGWNQNVTVQPGWPECSRSLHMKHIVAILWPHSAFTMVTLTTLCLTPMRQRSMGTREGMYVYVCERERWEECRFVAAVSFQTKTYTNSKKSWLPSLSRVLWNSPASVGTVLPYRPSLGLAVEATRVSIIVAAPNPVKTH